MREAAGIVDSPRVAALGGDELAELRQPAPIGERAIDRYEGLRRHARLSAADEHLRTCQAGELDQILRSACGETRLRLGDFWSVAYGSSERLVHVRELAG